MPVVLGHASGYDAFLSAAVTPEGVVTAAWYVADCPRVGRPGAPGQCAKGGRALAFAQLGRHARAFGPTRYVPPMLAGNLIADASVNAGPGGTALAWTETPGLESSVDSAQVASRRTTVIGSTGQSGPGDSARSAELVRTLLLAHVAHPMPATVFVLGPTRTSRRVALAPVVALASSGIEPTAAWLTEGWSGPPVLNRLVIAGERRADGTYGPALRLSPPAGVAAPPSAVATNANVVLVWPSGSYSMYRLHYAVRSSSGGFSADRLLAAGQAYSSPVLGSAPHAVVAAWVSAGRAKRTGLELAILRD
ncbi:MAG: hypothetical protein QOH12_537 [Solirubrobacteraceae bacterium]|nr:hypothetical protein [Solirubrobacteraceae bacterium]